MIRKNCRQFHTLRCGTSKRPDLRGESSDCTWGICQLHTLAAIYIIGERGKDAFILDMFPLPWIIVKKSWGKRPEFSLGENYSVSEWRVSVCDSSQQTGPHSIESCCRCHNGNNSTGWNAGKVPNTLCKSRMTCLSGRWRWGISTSSISPNIQKKNELIYLAKAFITQDLFKSQFKSIPLRRIRHALDWLSSWPSLVLL